MIAAFAVLIKLGCFKLLTQISGDVSAQLAQVFELSYAFFGHLVYLRSKRSILSCTTQSIGDGWCDHACNQADHKFDGGDCCPHTCKSNIYSCGTGGYDCKTSKVPIWFLAHTKFCYRWYPDGNGGQCGAGEPRDLCAYVNSYTLAYRDDTDNRGGGCRMSWGIESPYSQSWFKNVQVCYRWYPDGDGGQCGGGAGRLLCAPVGKNTPVYRDDTDNRGGGCRMSWQLKLPSTHAWWARRIQLCYQWYPDGDGGQCGGGADRTLCAPANSWTAYYRDDTDNRGGGCRMKWGLFYS